MGAANAGNVPIINHLLDNGAKIDITNPDGYGTALQNAAEHRHKDAAQVLLARGANPNINLFPQRTVLGAFAQNGDKETYDLIIDRIDFSKIDHGVLLADAAAGGNFSILRDLIENRKIKINSTYVGSEGKSYSALLSAVKKTKLEAVNYLLQHGAIVTKDIQAAINEGSMVANDVSRNGTNAAKDADTILARIRTHVAEKQHGQLLEVDPAFITHYVPQPAAPVTTEAVAPTPTPATSAAPATQHALTADETAYINAVNPVLEKLAGAATAAEIRQGLEQVFSKTAGNDDIAAGDPLEAQLKNKGLMTPGEFFSAKKAPPGK